MKMQKAFKQPCLLKPENAKKDSLNISRPASQDPENKCLQVCATRSFTVARTDTIPWV